VAFVHIFEKAGRRVVYAPCDIKPFPKHRDEVRRPDLLVIQPGIFEDGLKHGFRYPDGHVSRRTLYTFGQTMELVRELKAKKTVFVHLEEYWNRSHDDYLALEAARPGVRFAYDGMPVEV
jgi:phosphoribosyl 1,2-cyclic phosphate phosphodiesterase